MTHPDDVAARLDLVIEAFLRTILDTEAQQRTMLRLSLEAGPEERAGCRFAKVVGSAGSRRHSRRFATRCPLPRSTGSRSRSGV